ncbi:MAG: hypothetical protein IKS98_05425 [Lachnospiraceae bacterium]|nr:hypothetical protein [Lachnospiraceae bacterium]
MSIFSTNKKTKALFSGKRIGIFGLGPRCGVTHISVAVSNFLSDEAKLKVRLYEQSGHGDISRLIRYLGGSEIDKEFTFHRVTYVPFVKDSELLSDPDCDCMVFDLGRDFKYAKNTLKLCDIKIAVADDAPWLNAEYGFLDELAAGATDISNWRLFINLGDQTRMKEKEKYGMITGCFPFEPNPVYPCRETIIFLQEAFKK